MGISRISRRTWVAVPMMAATIGLAAPATANATTVVSADQRPVAASTNQSAASATTPVSLGSFVTDPRGSGPDRYRKLY